jgi:anti-sigma B factor antagonist
VLQDRLATEDLPGPRAGQRLLRLTGPILISNLFEFQSTVRADRSKTLVLDLAAVPYIDSAGIGALVGAFVAHQKDGRDLILLAVNERVRNALQVTRVESFFRFIDTLTDL